MEGVGCRDDSVFEKQVCTQLTCISLHVSSVKSNIVTEHGLDG